MKQMWDMRYGGVDYVYGTNPNVFFKERLQYILPGKLLLPAEGEGRNASYAASLHWDVQAFDFSERARKKAIELCEKNKVSIKYDIHSMEDAAYEKDSFDMLSFIYAHNPNRSNNHRHLLQFLKPGGLVILEAYSKSQIKYDTGGPKNIDMLYSIDELKEDFAELSELDVWEEEIILDEGGFHQGKSAVIRLTGKK